MNHNVVLSLKILMSSEDFQDNHSWRPRHLVDQYMNFEGATPVLSSENCYKIKFLV